jgi:cyclin A
VNLEHRRKVVAWLVKAFHVVSFEDQILYGTVHLADLYLDGCKKFVSGSILQSVVMACVCTMLKLATADHRVYAVPDLIAHITHNQITLERVLRVERDVLVGVDFNLSAPTMHQFLETLSMRLTPEKTRLSECTDWCGSVVVPAGEAVVGGPALARPKFFHLADFLCQLSLLHHELLDYLPSLVAASALVLAVWTLRGPAAIKAVLLEDIGCIWDVKGKDLRLCVAALHKEWVCPTDRDASLAVFEKFATPERQEVSDIPAPATSPLLA